MLLNCIADKIRETLLESSLEESLKNFFLSGEPAFIFGAGNQARIFLHYCRILHKQIRGILVSDINNFLLPDELSEEVFVLSEFIHSERFIGHDIVLAVGRSVANEVAFYLRDRHVVCVGDWIKANEILSECERKIYTYYDELCSNVNIAKEKNKKCYIHAGMQKAGSTTLQRFLWRNRNALYEAGFCYPEPMTDSEAHFEIFAGIRSPVNQYVIPASFYPGKISPLPIYNKMFSENLNKNFILSYETFCFYDPLFFEKHLCFDEIVFFLFLRTPLLYAQSYMLESVRANIFALENLLPLNTLSNVIFDQISVVNNFSISKKYKLNIQSIHSQNILVAFCALADIPTDGLNLNIPRANSSLGVDYAFFLAHLAVIPLSFESLRKILIEVYALSRKHPSPKYRLFSRRQISEIPLDLIHQYEELGKRIGDPDFWDRGYREVMAMEQCPYRQLSEDRQYEIFEQLTPESQQAILDVWPRSRELPGKLRGSAFLPDIPEDIETADALRLWCQRLRRT